MPIIPTVFRPIRSNDFQRRPFKVYKNYHISNTDVADTSSGYIQREAFFHRGSKYNIGDFSSLQRKDIWLDLVLEMDISTKIIL